ncbi:hypothetical protein AC1031_018221 [Aphanomyces cochlioides]|nr:hypothetical protein AC1031_018221 [Aphanomyces cochlioides]
MSHRLPQVTRLVLQVPELLRCIMQFKQGIYTDMLPLRYLAMPLTSNSADVFPSEFENIDLALSPWYFEHGYYRVLRLVDCIPRLLPIALYHGVYRGILPVVQLLASEYDLQVAAGQHHLLDIAAFSGSLDMFVYLWGVVGPRGMSSYAAEWSVENGHLTMVQYLVQNNLAVFDVRAVQVAAHWGHTELLHFLLDVVQPSSVEEALVMAASRGQVRAAQVLLDRMPNTPIDRAIQTAEGAGYDRMARWLRQQHLGSNF